MSVLELVETHPAHLTPLMAGAHDSLSKSPAIVFDHHDDLVDQVIAKVGKKIILGLPLAIGKPISFVNAIYQRAKKDPSISLTIETGITLEKPTGKSFLEKQFLGPFVEREFADVPDIEYMQDIRSGNLPDNVTVCEFFFKAGSCLYSKQQLNYTSTNYTHAVRDLIDKGVNVIAQLLASRICDGVTTYSLCSNSDLGLDLIPELDKLKAEGKAIAVVGEVNTNMPFMYNHAEVPASEFDFVLDANSKPQHHDYAIFAAPNTPISPEDHLIGLYSSTLVKDNGTLQVGIGSLSSALTYSTLLRHQHNDDYLKILKQLQIKERFPVTQLVGDTAPFNHGLYGCSELMVDGFLHLYDAGILKRQVFEDINLQHLLNNQKMTTKVSTDTLLTLCEHQLISEYLTESDVSYLIKLGVFKENVVYRNGVLHINGQKTPANLHDAQCLREITQFCLNNELKGGTVMHGAFFIGPQEFYQGLRDLTEEEHKHFCMTSVNYVNDLYDHMLGSQQLKQVQRQHARFINSGMMVTLDGSVVSDALANGQVVSGVGGQYNFVAQSHQLPGARSIIKIRSTCVRDGKLQSNILFNYGHTTIPRQLRDIVVTEYGIADLRGKPDHVVYTELIKIADSRFQPDLLKQAKAAGKVAKDYEIPAAFSNNTSESIHAFLAPYADRNWFTPFPFGCSFTDEELKLVKALKKLKKQVSTPKGKIKAITQAFTIRKATEEQQKLLKRMHLDDPKNLEQRMTQKLLINALR
ncbi:acetyl-CoA hydrolase/transferase C-terminal domain-containing protein [Photobacterium sanguinicancri]|uniref:acetyl-CoA hydrolase/transferase C-terminal domain-containing protein n=1 Tax=Photobacterium sanguinicancri TaxID=875932 RepID=UPI002480B630|nr:acetyl-CoA hydrolase/transferase C-terminal domain-containing protein [Photobacterium sanguinicancri]